ncbi:MAG: DUF3365 domain-containing protein [Bacteroidota bacterium]
MCLLFVRLKSNVLCLVVVAMLLIGTCSCGNLREKSVDTKAMADEVKNREIKHITQAQLDETANEWGNHVAQTAQKDLAEVLTAALAKYPLEEAAAFCRVKSLYKADSLSQSYKALLNRSSLRELNKPTKLTETERQVLDAYLYNAENKLPQRPNVQRLEDKYLLYTTPIVLDNPLCFRCHGEVGENLTSIDQRKLMTRYKLDSLVNRKENSLLGMWRIAFEKKEMIKRIDVK